jgi:hypothetical protein
MSIRPSPHGANPPKPEQSQRLRATKVSGAPGVLCDFADREHPARNKPATVHPRPTPRSRSRGCGTPQNACRIPEVYWFCSSGHGCGRCGRCGEPKDRGSRGTESWGPRFKERARCLMLDGDGDLELYWNCALLHTEYLL